MKSKKDKFGNTVMPPLRIQGKVYQQGLVEQGNLAIDGPRSYGICDNRHQRLNYDANQGFDQLRETTIHEILHVWEQSFNVKMEHKDIHSLAVYLYQVLKDNPTHVKWLMETEK